MLILNMDMPANCSDCPCFGVSDRCAVSGTSFAVDNFDDTKDKLPDCPIICEFKMDCEDLIDNAADMVKAYSGEDNVSFVMSIVPESYDKKHDHYIELHKISGCQSV